MTKRFALAALLAASAMTPALAQVQVEGPGEPRERPEMREMREARAERPQQAERTRPDGGGWQGRANDGNGGGVNGGGWQARVQPQAPVAQPQPAPQPVAPPAQQGGWRNNSGGGADTGGWRSRGNWGGNATAAPDRPRWNRDTAPTGQMGSTPAAPPPQAVPEQRRWEGARSGGSWNGTPRPNGGWTGTPRPNGDWNRDGRRDEAQGRSDTWRNDNWRNQARPGDNRWQGNRDWNNGSGWGNRGGDNRQWNNRDWNNSRAWNRDWRRNQQYDWQRYRYSNRDLFRARPYYAPYGWNYGYRRFSIGLYLNDILFDQRYWIDDPYDYRLPPVYGPYRWVRYYDDVLLVDLRSGQVVDVIYDFFW